MDLLSNVLKGQVNTLNFLLFLILATLVFYKIRKRKIAVIFSVLAGVFFAVTATAYLPNYLIKNLESRYPPFDNEKFMSRDKTVFIHVLGGGYAYDKKIPAQAQLSLNSLGRLAEGIRISRTLPENKLVFSGNKASGDKSLALVSKNAAVVLGVDTSKIEMLETPATTLEEATAFTEEFGTDVTLILVTDALHMPRAMKFFVDQGLDPYPAPTNYLVRKNNNPYNMAWLPSVGNMLNMDRVIHEFFGQVKGNVTR